MSDPRASKFWDFFSRHQRQASRKPSTPDAWALDDGLNAVLSRNGDLHAADLAELQRQFRSRCRNRRQTHIHRFKLLREKYSTTQSRVENRDPAERLIRLEQLEWVRRNTSDREWFLLRELAAGKTYNDISHECDAAVSTLKSSAARCRARLKEQWTAENVGDGNR